MPTLQAEININAPPEVVREVFLNFPELDKWHDLSFFKSIESTTSGKSTGMDMVPKDTVKVAFPNQAFTGVVTHNSPEYFSWCGSLPYIFTGTHYFTFNPDPRNKNGTHFVQHETFTGLASPLMSKSIWGKGTEAGWNRVNQQLKKEAERVWNERNPKA